MKVEVTKEKVVITEYSSIHQGEVNVNACQFDLPECFEGLSVTAVFNKIPVPVSDNRCTIPSLEKGTVTLGVYAYLQEGDNVKLMYSPKPTFFYVDTGSYTKEISVENIPSITEFEQYCNILLSEVQQLLVGVENQKNRVTEITEDSTDEEYPTAKAVNDTVRDVRGEVISALGEADYKDDISDTLEISQGIYSKLTGAFATTAVGSQGCSVFAVQTGDKYYITGAYGYAAALVAAFDENQAYLADCSVFSDEEKNITAEDYEYTVPEGVSYIGFSTRLTAENGGTDLTVKKLINKLRSVEETFQTLLEPTNANIEKLQIEAEDLKKQIDDRERAFVILQLGNINNTALEAGGIDTNGEDFTSASNTRSAGFIPVVSGKSFYAIVENTTQRYINVRYYDKDKSFVSADVIYAKKSYCFIIFTGNGFNRSRECRVYEVLYPRIEYRI